VAVGLWVMSASQTFDAACTLGAQSGGGTICISGLPSLLFGIAITAAGVVCTTITLSTSIRGIRRSRREQSTISTLHLHGEESLRDVA
jgi:hypothetical protein